MNRKLYNLSILALYILVFTTLIFLYFPSANSFSYFIGAVTFFIGLLWIKWKLPILIGRAGEKFVSKQLHTLGSQYKVFDDLLVASTGHFLTTQIDHVVVSNFGIFCIETKDYTGSIIGNAYEKQWIQNIYGFRYLFNNPIHQNFVHIRSLKALISKNFNIEIHSLVVFPKANRLLISGTNEVGTCKEMIEKIKSYKFPVISDYQRNEIVKILEAANIKDKMARKLHIRSLNKKII